MPIKRLFVFILAAIAIQYAISAEASVVKEGLISYWTFDISTIKKDGTVEDIVGDNDGKLVGNPETVEGMIGDALRFAGSDNIRVESDKSLQLTKAFTIDTWVKGDSAPDKSGTVRQWFSKGTNYLLSWDHNAETYQSIATQMTGGWLIIAQIKETLNGGEWYHIAGTWDSRSLKIYLNGKLSKTRTWTGTPTVSEDPLIIGGPGFIGAVDEAKLYDRALTEAEIMRNFQDRWQLAVSPARSLPDLWGKLKSR